MLLILIKPYFNEEVFNSPENSPKINFKKSMKNLKSLAPPICASFDLIHLEVEVRVVTY